MTAPSRLWPNSNLSPSHGGSQIPPHTHTQGEELAFTKLKRDIAGCVRRSEVAVTFLSPWTQLHALVSRGCRGRSLSPFVGNDRVQTPRLTAGGSGRVKKRRETHTKTPRPNSPLAGLLALLPRVQGDGTCPRAAANVSDCTGNADQSLECNGDGNEQMS